MPWLDILRRAFEFIQKKNLWYKIVYDWVSCSHVLYLLAPGNQFQSYNFQKTGFAGFYDICWRVGEPGRIWALFKLIMVRGPLITSTIKSMFLICSLLHTTFFSWACGVRDCCWALFKRRNERISPHLVCYIIFIDLGLISLLSWLING